MKFVYPYGGHFPNKKLIQALSEAAIRLAQKLKKIDLEQLEISDYIKNYASKHIAELEHTLEMYTYLFYLALDRHPRAINKIVLVDYGGGTGILSFLAAELGVAKVIYTDVYDVCCQDAQILSQALAYEIEFVEGGIRDLVNYCQQQKIQCHAVLSSEVIEHVYDIKELLENMHHLGAQNAMRLVLETAANSLNPIINRRLIKAQKQVDRTNREMVYGKKKQDSLQAYFDIRVALLESYAQGKLNPKEINQLALLTRGKIKADIEFAAKKYLETGTLPNPIDHPSNTCDPITGNWCEKLMNPFELNEILEKHGFKTEVLKGFYGASEDTLIKNLGKIVFNTMIGLLGSKGVHLSPYYVLWAERNC